METIDSVKKADALNKACVAVGRQTKLKVYVQVNTSGEEGIFLKHWTVCTMTCGY